ncbi:serine/threonine-protein kinase [Actinoplanes sp. NPDC049681]|uniref:serine/threonine-protein kinase n=1 Tax=Actinoplanes sp. NPDC049681 TaxID=3363905 RepID=UPI0037919189
MPPFADPPEQVTDPAAGVVVGGRYRLLQRIGSGGMGVVWSGRDEVLRRRVAVKELRHGWGSSDRTVAEGRERSLREARAAAALDHPGIVSVYDIVEHDGRPWIVMELVNGRSLKDVVADEGPLPVGRAVGIAVQLLAALEAAHRAGITHRDVKPANVLVSEGDRVRLTDFGLAVLPDAETLTETGVALGTPGYLAPEQAKGLPPGPAADVFGFGATLYYAIEGSGPFQRDGYLPMLVAYTRHEIRPPRRAGELAPLLMRLLSADPAKRPTAEECRRLLLGGAVRRPALSRRLLLAGATVTAAAAIGGGFWGTARREVPRTSPAPPPRPVGLGEPAWHSDDVPNAVLVDGTFVSGHTDAVVALDAETGKERWRSGPRVVYRVAAIGTAMVAVDEGERYRVLDAGTGAVRWRSPARANSVAGVEGLFLVLPASDGPGSTMIAYDAGTGRRRWGLHIDDYFGYQQVAGPGGGFCVVVGHDDESWLYGIDTPGAKVLWKTRLSPAPDNSVTLWGHGDRAYAVILDHRGWILVAVDARTGRRAWSVPLVEHPGGPVQGLTEQDSGVTVEVDGLAFAGGLVVAAVTSEELTLRHAGLVAMDAGTGAVRWRRPLLNPTVAAAGDRLFAGAHDSVLHELDPATGRTVWSATTPGPASRLHVGRTMLIAGIGSGATAYPLG